MLITGLLHVIFYAETGSSETLTESKLAGISIVVGRYDLMSS